jgi:tetratricopeptide (TPR) repeat protein
MRHLSRFRRRVLMPCATLLLLSGPAAAGEGQRPAAPVTPAEAAREASPELKPAPPAPALNAPGEEIPDWQARWELARVLSYAKRYEESVAEYRTLLRKRPELTAARVELAAVQYYRDRPQAALETLEPVEWSAVAPTVLLTGVDVYLATGKYQQAETLLRGLLEEAPEHRGARRRLAALLSWTERYEESLQLYRSLLDQTPKDTSLRRKYALVLIWAGNLEQGAAELRATLPDEEAGPPPAGEEEDAAEAPPAGSAAP